jgi:transcriptional repressor NrdR
VECMVMERENVTAKELTRYILAELKKVNEEWYRNWIVFDQAVKRRRTEEELN